MNAEITMVTITKKVVPIIITKDKEKISPIKSKDKLMIQSSDKYFRQLFNLGFRLRRRKRNKKGEK